MRSMAALLIVPDTLLLVRAALQVWAKLNYVAITRECILKVPLLYMGLLVSTLFSNEACLAYLCRCAYEEDGGRCSYGAHTGA